MLIFLTFYHHVTITYPNLFLGIIGRKTIPAPRSGKYTHTWVRGCLCIHNYKYTKSLGLPVKCVLLTIQVASFFVLLCISLSVDFIVNMITPSSHFLRVLLAPRKTLVFMCLHRQCAKGSVWQYMVQSLRESALESSGSWV